MLRKALAILLVLVAAFTPVGALSMQPAGGPAPTTLFFHILDAQNDVPINTQEPPSSYHIQARVGAAANSLCLSEAAAVSAVFDKEFHTFFGYASPAVVEYEYADSRGYPLIHPERGVDADVEVAGSAVFHWYLASGAGSGQDEPAGPFIPNVVVRATMREGDAISVGDEAYREGNVIMRGLSEPALLAGPLTEGAEHIVVDGVDVYHLQVPMTIESTTIPVVTGFNIGVEVFMENPVCAEEGGYVMPNLVDVYSSDGHRPRLELGVLNPLQAHGVGAGLVGDHLMIYGHAGSPWGMYDVARSEVVVVQGDLRLPAAFVDPGTQFHCHCYGDPEPANWIVENATRQMKDGPYSLEFTLSNLQGHNETIVIPMGEEAAALEMPGPGILVGLVALGLASAIRRRE